MKDLSFVQDLFESAEVQNAVSSVFPIMEEHIDYDMADWMYEMKNFVVNNLEDFVGLDLNETASNIYTFSAFATQQYLAEMSMLYGSQIEECQNMKIRQANEFLM